MRARVNGIKGRIIPGEYDPGVLKAKLIADFIENSIAHLPVSEQIQIYDQLIAECDEEAKKEKEGEHGSVCFAETGRSDGGAKKEKRGENEHGSVCFAETGRGIAEMQES